MSRPFAFFVAFLFLILPGVTSSVLRLPSSELSQYRRSHSLNDSYNFDPRDGWTTLNATTLQRAIQDDVAALEPKSQKRGFSAAVESAFKSIKAIGKAVGVEITWCVFSTHVVSLFINSPLTGILATIYSIRVVGQSQFGLPL